MNGIGIGSGLSANQKTSLQVPFKLKQGKTNDGLRGKLADDETVPVLYDKSCSDFKDNSKKRLAWEDFAKQIKVQTGMYRSSEYSFI